MPHVVVKGKVEGHETTIFGLSQADANSLRNKLTPWGGRVGQDGQSYRHPPLFVISTLEEYCGFRLITSTMGTQQTAVWTLHRSF